MSTTNIKKLRKAIDALDEKLIGTLNKRTKLAISIGKIKEQLKESVYSPEREQQVYNRISKFNKGPLDKKTLRAIYREIMSGTIMLQKPLKQERNQPKNMKLPPLIDMKLKNMLQK